MTGDDGIFACPHCGGRATAAEPSCRKCGNTFLRLCRCGRTVSLFDRTCPACGARQAHRTPRSRPRRLLRSARKLVSRGLGGLRFILGAPFRWGPLRRLSRRIRRWPAWVRVALVLVLLGAGGLAVYRLTGDRVPMRVRSFKAGVAGFDAGRFAESAQWMRRVLAEDPRHAFARYLLGRCLCATGRAPEGLAEIRRSLEIDPTSAVAATFLAETAFAEGHDGEATAILRRSASHRPLSADARLLLAKIALRSGRVDSGLKDLTAAVSQSSLQWPVEAMLLLADLLDRRGSATGRVADRVEARRLFERVLSWEVEPDAKVSEENLAVAALGTGKVAAALKHAEMATRGAVPADARRLGILKARILATQGDLEAAEAAADASLDSGAESADFLAVAAFFARAGLDERRRATLAAARERFPGDADVLLAWAEAFAGAGRGAEVLGTLRSAGAARPDILLAGARIERALGREEEYRKALAAAAAAFPDDRAVRAEALALRVEAAEAGPGRPSPDDLATLKADVAKFLEESGEPAEPTALLLSGRLLLVEGNHREGVERLLTARAEAPFDGRIAAAAALALMRAGLDEEVVATLERASAPGSEAAPQAAVILGESLLRLRRFGRAASVLREVLANDPGNHAARRLLARVCLASDRHDAALAEYARLAKELPEDFEAASKEGYLLLETGQSDDPATAFARALSLARTTAEAVEVARLAALARGRNGGPGAAEAAFRQMLAGRPGDARTAVAEARLLLSIGKGAEARAVLDAAVAAYPDDPELRRLLGEVALSGGGGAEEVARQVEAIERASPGHPDAAYLRGRAALAAGDLKKAADELAQDLARRPLDTRALLALGLALVRDGRPEEATRHLKLARSVDPESDPIRVALARALAASGAKSIDRGEIAEAKERLTESRAEDRGGPGVAFLLASSLAVLGDLEAAERECEDARRRDPHDLGAIRLLAALKARRGDLEGAGEECRLACAQTDRPDYDYLLLAWIEYRRGRADAAAEAARRAIGSATPSLPAAEVLVRSLVAAGRGSEAEAFLADLRGRYPDEALPHALLAYALGARGDLDGAAAQYEAALDRDPAMHSALKELVTLELETRGDGSAALARVEARLAKSPDAPYANYLAGWVLSRLVRKEEAVTRLRPALAVDPTLRPAALLLASLLVELNDPPGARAAVAPLLKQDEDDREALLMHAGGLDLEGSWPEAVAAYRQVLAVDGRCVPAMNNLALRLLATPAGRAEAKGLVERAIGFSPADPNLFDSLGQVHAAMGNHAPAVEAFRKALEGFEAARARCDVAGRAAAKDGSPERARETARVVAQRIERCRARLAASEAALLPK